MNRDTATLSKKTSTPPGIAIMVGGQWVERSSTEWESLKMKRLFAVTIILTICLGCLSSCGIKITETESEKDSHSRELITTLSEGFGFGFGRIDDIDVALEYVYHEKYFEDKYGSTFDVDSAGGSSECKSLFFPWLIKGTGTSYIEIQGDTWKIDVKKGYFGKWQVTDYSLSDSSGK